MLRLLIILLLVLNALAFAAMRGWLGSPPTIGEPDRIASQLDPQRIRLTGEAAPSQQQAMANPVGASLPPSPVVPEPAETPLAPPSDAVPGDLEQASGADADERDVAVDNEAMTASDTQSVITGETVETPPQPSDDIALPQQAAETATDAASAVAEAAPETASASPPLVCHAWANLTADHAERLSQRLRRIGATPIRTRTETPDSWWVRIPPQRSREEAERRVIELNLLGVTDTFIVQESGPTQYAVSLGVFKTENRARILLGQLRTRGVTNAGIEPRMATTYRIQASFRASELRATEAAAPGLRGKRQACTAR
jgi:hypothetical protein